MNDIFERMKKLLTVAGINFDESSFSYAEILSYSDAASAVKQAIEDIPKAIFLTEYDDSDCLSYADMLGLRASEFTNEELTELIISRLSYMFGDYTKENFQKAFEVIGSGEYAVEQGTVVFYDIDRSDFYRLGKFIQSYIPVFTSVFFDGTGADFDFYDSWGQTFEFYDSLCLPFSIFDTMRNDYSL